MSTNELAALMPIAPVDSIDVYLRWVNKIPLLSAEEELELSTRLYKHNDLQAAQRLITSNLRYVVKIARSYMGYGLMLADLIQEGTIGLMKAVKRFNPEKGVRLISFAVHWIKAEIHEFILANWRIVKIATTKAQRKLFFNLRSSKKELKWLSSAEIKAIAEDLGVKPEEVTQMEQRLSNYDTQFEAPLGLEDKTAEHATLAPEDFVEANEPGPLALLEQNNWDTYITKKLYAAIAELDARSKEILEKRWFNEQKATLQELATQYNVTPERIRQLETLAINKLKLALSQVAT